MSQEIPSTMRAMAAAAHGGPEVLQWHELPIPEVGEYDLLVEVQAAALNPVDTKIRQDSRFPRTFPIVLGGDVCGKVVALGPRAAGFAVGDEIYASPNLMRNGSNAEYVAVDSRSAAPKPKTVDAVHAAALPLVALTAWESLYLRARVEPGATVLIHAGAGGVGHIAVQLAKLRGCRVITTAGRPESLAFCRDVLKADEVIDYRSRPFAAQVLELTGGQGCPCVFDTVGGEVFEQSLECVALNGHLVTILPSFSKQVPAHFFLKNISLHYEFMGVPTAFNVNPGRQGEILRAVANLVDAGLLRPHVSHTLPLAELAEAHRLQETGRTIGKIVVTVS